MSSEVLETSSFSPDIREFLRLLSVHEVRAVVVGGEAVIFYGHIRVTGDIDLYYDRSPENAGRLFDALEEFWQGAIPELEDSSELEQPGVIFQFGVPPNRIDLLNDIDGVEFETVWSGRTQVELQSGSTNVPLSYIGLEELIRNKEASARPKDLEDLPFLVKARNNAQNDH
jgi:hypothetical protein